MPPLPGLPMPLKLYDKIGRKEMLPDNEGSVTFITQPDSKTMKEANVKLPDEHGSKYFQ